MREQELTTIDVVTRSVLRTRHYSCNGGDKYGRHRTVVRCVRYCRRTVIDCYITVV